MPINVTTPGIAEQRGHVTVARRGTAVADSRRIHQYWFGRSSSGGCREAGERGQWLRSVFVDVLLQCLERDS